MDEQRGPNVTVDSELIERHIEWAEEHDERKDEFRDVRIVEVWRVTTHQIVSVDHLNQSVAGMEEEATKREEQKQAVLALKEDITSALNITESEEPGEIGGSEGGTP